jgi:hypothetical protein
MEALEDLDDFETVESSKDEYIDEDNIEESIDIKNEPLEEGIYIKNYGYKNNIKDFEEYNIKNTCTFIDFSEKIDEPLDNNNMNLILEKMQRERDLTHNPNNVNNANIANNANNANNANKIFEKKTINEE